MRFLSTHAYYRRIQKAIIHFLLPIKLDAKTWTTKIPLCSVCQHLVEQRNSHIKKIMHFEKNDVAIRMPINCKSKNIHIILRNRNENESTTLINISSLHTYLQKNKKENIDILPNE